MDEYEQWFGSYAAWSIFPIGPLDWSQETALKNGVQADMKRDLNVREAHLFADLLYDKNKIKIAIQCAQSAEGDQ